MSNSDREEFEKWYLDQWGYGETGPVLIAHKEGCRQAWQAARAESVQRPSVAGSVADNLSPRFKKVWGKFLDVRRFEKSEIEAFIDAIALWDYGSLDRTSPPITPKRVQIPCPAECDDGVDWSSKTAEICKTCEGAGTFYATPPITDHAGEEKVAEQPDALSQDEKIDEILSLWDGMDSLSCDCGTYNSEVACRQCSKSSEIRYRIDKLRQPRRESVSQLLALLDAPGLREEIINLVDKRAAVAMYENSESDTITAILDAIKKRVGL